MRFTYGRKRSKAARCTTADKSPATEDGLGTTKGSPLRVPWSRIWKCSGRNDAILKRPG